MQAERDARIIAMAQMGTTPWDIACYFRMTVHRVKQIIKDHQKRQAAQPLETLQ